MKHFLFITDWINPFEPTFGGAQRSHLLLRALLKFGNVDVIAFTDGIVSNLDGCNVVYSKPTSSAPQISRLKKWCGLFTPWNPYSIFSINKEKESIVSDFVNQHNYDAIVVRYTHEAMSSGLIKYADRLIIDVDDHPKDALKNTAKSAKSMFNKLYHYLASSLSNITIRHLSNNISATLFPNLNQMVGRNAYFLPNISLEEPKVEYPNYIKVQPILFFVGRLDYAPNYLGLDHFINNIWKHIKCSIPRAELRIAGKIDESNMHIVEPYFRQWRNIDGITLLGFVDDINTEYARCKATISPIYLGAGTNIKLIESMHRKRTCITTECGVRGLNKFLTPDLNVLVARNDQMYADLCIKVLTDDNLNHQIAKNAYSVVSKYFSHKVFEQTVVTIVNKLK